MDFGARRTPLPGKKAMNPPDHARLPAPAPQKTGHKKSPHNADFFGLASELSENKEENGGGGRI